ncbi:DNA polymerase III subunit delta [Paroceanicella profunda]|uniref:DNA-directed DNA polymerase n=1 Tax=Paroceanicella profunda TaxID=2579971 RepID=A0A5B8FG98_9RHOB|nr:DNA polymerase III subunit delta [Paroceanicella profunda]QDL90867.1 DNA polymerase III subunit delta [Paroceanicella profunda]
MKLKGREIAAFLARPDVSRAGCLVYGADAIAVDVKRAEAVAALVGPEGEAEMRLERFDGASLRTDPARLQDALRAQGFFPGQRVVLLEDATDGLTDIIAEALDATRPGADAFLIVTAGVLAARSKLRKMFEARRDAVVCPLYSDPPGRDEVETALRRAGLAAAQPDAVEALVVLSREIDLGAFNQVLAHVALYKLGDPEPLTAAEVALCAPATTEAGLDEVIRAVAEGEVVAIGRQMARLAGQGVNATTLCISATRHFRQLHAIAAAPDGPEAALGRARPPVFGPRRDALLRQVRGWGPGRIERVLSLLTDTDLTLRSSSGAPPLALIERAFIRIAMLRGAR